jgi:hypothetical protein
MSLSKIFDHLPIYCRHQFQVTIPISNKQVLTVSGYLHCSDLIITNLTEVFVDLSVVDRDSLDVLIITTSDQPFAVSCCL